MLPKIFLFTDWYLPGYKAGGPIQACRNIVEALKDLYEFFIFTSDRDLGDRAPYENIRADQWVPELPTVNIWYASPSFVTLRNLRGLLNQVKPEFVYFNSMFSVKYTLLPLWLLLSARFPGKIILAPRGMLHQGALQRKSLKKNIFLRLFKISGWHKRIQFQATVPQELKDILFFFGAETAALVLSDIPNLYKKDWQGLDKEAGKLKCIFISRIEAKKNLHYFLERLGELGKQVQVSLDIYGLEEDPDYAARCRKLIALLGQQDRVRFMGPLPNAQVYDTLSHYHIFVLTTMGENFGYAIMEALSAGKPVLISDQTPWRGLVAKKAGWDLPLDKPEQFRLAIEQAAGFEQREYGEWSRHAWQFARDYGEGLNPKEEYSKLFQ